MIESPDSDEASLVPGETSESGHCEVVDEIRAEICLKSRLLIAQIDGQLTIGADRIDQATEWALRAQRGTLEKFVEVFLGMDASRSVELVALSRNLFENLIWLRLFDKNRMYGLLFYRQLLQAQLDSQKQAIEKAKEEIILFKKADELDNPDFSSFDEVFSKDHPTEEELVTVGESMRRQREEVDQMVRDQFSLYAKQAKYNGYGYQAHLIERKALPKHEEQIILFEEHLAALDDTWSGLPMELQKDFGLRWNWLDRAKSVDMESHYRFLYSFTSKLLHSTPLNLITPKTLNAQEVDMLLDYLRIGISKSHHLIESFSYPGKIKVLVL